MNIEVPFKGITSSWRDTYVVQFHFVQFFGICRPFKTNRKTFLLSIRTPHLTFQTQVSWLQFSMVEEDIEMTLKLISSFSWGL